MAELSNRATAKVQKALRALNAEIDAGTEFPDAEVQIVELYGLTEEQAAVMRELYDREVTP